MSGQSTADGGTESRERLTTTVSKETKAALKETPGAMGEQIDEFVGAGEDDLTFHYINTNAKHLPDDGGKIFKNRVAVTYGEWKFGKKLRNVTPGDIVIPYVSDGYTQGQGGVKGFGVARAPWDGDDVTGQEQIYPSAASREFHLPMAWTVVLPERLIVTPEEKKDIIGPLPTGTKMTVSDENFQRQTKILVRVIRDRFNYPQFR